MSAKNTDGYWSRFQNWSGQTGIAGWKMASQGTIGVNWRCGVEWCKVFAYRDVRKGQYGVLIRLTGGKGRVVWEQIKETEDLPVDVRLSSFPDDVLRPRWNVVMSRSIQDMIILSEEEQFRWICDCASKLSEFMVPYIGSHPRPFV
jgi:hypothetical protein